METEILSRIQFAANISFHILFPTITIALGWILLFFKLRYNKTQDEKWIELYFLFTKIFALTFALGVVSGVVMSFQFGTNWSGFMNKVGNIAGPLLAYEVLTAFFLEATFLAVMLFGFRKVKPAIHNLATFLVAFGTTLSAFWILVLNSWMQTPAGHEEINGVIYAKNWLEIIFNPSMPYRLSHMLIASFLTASFLVAGVLSYKFLKEGKTKSIAAGLKTAIAIILVLAPLQIFVGDMHGLNTKEYQPQKVAAMEGLWETKKGVPLILFAIVDEENRENKFEIKIPKVTSLILTHDLDGEVKGLNDFKGDHPPVAPVFYSFRIMVGVGILMALLGFVGAYQIFYRKEFGANLAKIFLCCTFIGWVAVLAGWYVTEIGRQPWLVYGILKTKDAISAVDSSNVATSLTAYIADSFFIFSPY